MKPIRLHVLGDAYPQSLLVAYGIFWALLAIDPVNREDWLLENILVFVFVPLGILTYRRLRFTAAAYSCLFVFFLFHAIGAHYTYSLVPYDEWSRAWFGRGINAVFSLERNQFDRFVHFLYGVLIAVPAVELLDRFSPQRSGWRVAMPILFVMSHSVIYEVLEWLAAVVVARDLGQAYLGTQGDVWDAQKDMALAAVGAAIGVSIIRFARRKNVTTEPTRGGAATP